MMTAPVNGTAVDGQAGIPSLPPFGTALSRAVADFVVVDADGDIATGIAHHTPDGVDDRTAATLSIEIALIASVVATVLARQMKRERLSFKGLVRELRDLGLIYALDVGYSQTPRGRAYLKASAE